MAETFFYDIETLGTGENSVILSAAILPIDFAIDFTFEECLKLTAFVKFDVQDQVNNHGRKIELDTLNWWGKQDASVKLKSFKPNPELDMPFQKGMDQIRGVFSFFGCDKNSTIWTRGTLDSVATEHAFKSLGLTSPYPYYRVRDVRTAIDILYGSDNGYCKTSLAMPGLTKHDPVHDVSEDAVMLRYGIAE